MKNQLMLALLVMILVDGVYAQSVTSATVDVTQPTAKRLTKEYAPTPGLMRSAVYIEVAPAISSTSVSNVTDEMSMRLGPLVPQVYSYGNGGFNLPDNYTDEGFITPPGRWFGNQPYLPYYGYNPPTTTGSYPPYAYNAAYGYGPWGYGSYGQIVPAPLLASPPALVPYFTTPVMPPPLDIATTPFGIMTRRDPNFQLFFVPQPPNYLTTGSAIYQTPPPFYYPPFP